MKPEESASINLQVKAVPGASSTQIAGFLGEALKVRVAAPPEKGKANQAIRKLLSETLELPLESIELIRGESNARKVFCITGLSEQQLKNKLELFR